MLSGDQPNPLAKERNAFNGLSRPIRFAIFNRQKLTLALEPAGFRGDGHWGAIILGTPTLPGTMLLLARIPVQ